MTEAILQTNGLSKSFGALQVADNITFSLRPGARHALIGPNGAGKTTFINLLTGALQPSSGIVKLAGQNITGISQNQRVKLGIVRTFQINTLFMGLTVIENISLAVCERMGVANEIFRPIGLNIEMIAEARGLLEILNLESDALIPVQELPYGRQRLVEIAIAMALNPKVLLLDEPAAGVPDAESQLILDAIDSLPDEIAVLIIEHDMDVVFRFAHQITVLVRGAILSEGPPEMIANDREVQAVYLGKAANV